MKKLSHFQMKRFQFTLDKILGDLSEAKAE